MERRNGATALAACLLLLGAVAPTHRDSQRPLAVARADAAAALRCDAPNLLRDCGLETVAGSDAGPASWLSDRTVQGGEPGDPWVELGAAPGGASLAQLLSQPLAAGSRYLLLLQARRSVAADGVETPPLDLLLAPGAVDLSTTDTWRIGGPLCGGDDARCEPPRGSEWATLQVRFSAPTDAPQRPYFVVRVAAREGTPASDPVAVAIRSLALYELPEPAYAFGPDCGAAPLAVAFHAPGSGIPGLEWRWSFGDGQAATGNPVEHVFERGGLYEPALQLRVGSGAAIVAGGAADGEVRRAIRVIGGRPAEPYLYWTETRADGGRTIVRSSLDGDGVEPLRVVGEPVGGLAVDSSNGHLYWTQIDPGGATTSLMRSDLLGCAAEVLTARPARGDGLGDVAIDEMSRIVYWSDPSRGAVFRLAVAGSEEALPEVVFEAGVADLSRPRGLAADASQAQRIGWTQAGDLAMVGSVDIRDPEGSVRVADLPAYDLALHRRGAFATLPESHRIVRLELDAAATLRSLCDECGRPLELTIDRAGRRIYWIDGGGELRGMFTTRGTPGTIVRGRGRPQGLAVYEPVATPEVAAERSR